MKKDYKILDSNRNWAILKGFVECETVNRVNPGVK